jgi:hypothetical protein
VAETILHRDVAVLKVEDAGVFDEIRAILPLEDYVLGTLSDTELVIDPRRVKELSSRLESRGMAPLVKKG